MENIKVEKHVTKRVRLITKKWTREEEEKILDYLLNTIQGNDNFQKPTAAVFYGKMKNILNLSANVAQLKNKVKNLKKNYEKSVEWKNQTGQGVDSGTVKEKILQMCPNFDLLEEIFGSKTNIQPPYIYDSTTVEEVSQHYKLEESGESTIPDMIASENGNSSTSIGQAEEIESHENSENSSTNFEPECFKKYHSSTPRKRKEPSISVANIVDVQKRRVDVLAKRNEIEKKKFERELKLAEEKFNFEKIKFEKNMELKTLNLEIKLKEIESNERQKVLQLAKEEKMERLKMELDFKLELEKIKKTNF